MGLKIGDIVKKKVRTGRLEYFIIVDIEDFTDEQGTRFDGRAMIEVAKIYPVFRVSTFEITDDSDFELVASTDTKDYKIFMDYVDDQRKKFNWHDEADYISVLTDYHGQGVWSQWALGKAKNNDKNEVVAMKNDSYKSEPTTPRQTLDIIRYDIIPTIDQCLDALNDLKDLHENFGDEAYLQLKDVVIKRLQYLQKIN